MPTVTALEEAEAAFEAHYANGGTGLADIVWRRIATRFGVLGARPETTTS